MKLQHYLLGGALCAFSVSGLAAEMKNPLSVHVLNLQTGVPTAGIEVELDKQQGEEWVKLAQGTTNEQGRIPALYPAGQKAQTGIYRVVFKTGDYYKKKQSADLLPGNPGDVQPG